MKIPFVLACTCVIFSIKQAAGSAIGAPFYPLAAEDLSDGDIKELEYWDKYYHRPKRSESAWSTGSGSGSGDILNQLKSAVVSGLKHKIVQVAKGSAGAVAGASAGFSKGSFGGDSKSYHHSHSYEPPPHEHDDDHKDFNVWELKKSVLNTLLQAVKAIKGGVLAIKGQLIKGSGYIVSGGGKLLASGGDKVTKLGKNIINNAVLVHPSKEHYIDHGSHSSYSAPSGPPVYDAPSSSGHGFESHYESHPYDHAHDKPYGGHAGILILRRIPTTTHDKYHSSHSHVAESVVPAFKPLSATGPTFGTLVGKFFTASTSLDPSEPSGFTNSDIHPSVHSYGDVGHYGEDPRSHHEPSPSVSYQAPLINEHKIVSASDFSSGENLLPPSPPATSYGVPFDGFHGNNLGAAESHINEQRIKLTKGELLEKLEGSPTLASSEVQVAQSAPDSLQALKNAVNSDSQGHTLGPPFNSDYMPNNYHKSPSSSTNYVRNALLAESAETPNENLSILPNSKENFSQEHQQQSDLLADFLPKQDSSFSASQEASNELNSKESYMKFLENFPFHKVRPSSPKSSSSKARLSQKLRVVRVPSDYKQESSSRPHYSVMKSVSYEITPQGVKRLT